MAATRTETAREAADVSAPLLSAETIGRIVRFDGGGLPVVSLYFAISPDRRGRRALASQVTSLLHRIRPQAEDRSLERDARMSLRRDIEQIAAAAHRGDWDPGGLALFSCSGAGFYEEVPLPRPVRDRAVVDATPWTRAMLAVLDEYHRCCVVVIDRKSARIWELYQQSIEEVTGLDDESPRKPDFAGWAGYAEHGVRNRADELAKRHYRRSATAAERVFRARGCEILAVGGHQEELPHFLEFVPRALRPRIAGTFSIDPQTATPASVRDQAGGVVDRYERDEERRLVAEVMETAAAGGLAAVGLEPCLWAGSIAAVGQLLVEEGAVAPGVVCDACGWLALEAGRCALCGRPTRSTPDVIDELVESVIEEAGAVEHVLADTALKESRVAASLRFPLPAPPEPGDPPSG